MHTTPQTRFARLSHPARSWTLALGLVLVLASPGVAQERPPTLGDLTDSIEDLATAVRPSVVQIFASGLSIRRSAQATGQEGVVSRQSASGSGVIVDPAGYIVTNAHVVAGATRVEVSLPERVPAAGESIVEGRGALALADVIGLDAESDLAVLKIDEADLPFLPFGDSDLLQQGELVFAFGSPLGLRNSMSMGVVSSVARQLEPESSMIYVQTDAAVNPGNSGGPLVNARGELVGINTLIFSRSGGSDGLSFAAPSNIVRTVYTQIKDEGRVRRGTIGARSQTITPRLAAGLMLPRPWGVILSDVSPGSPAAVAGLRVGDVVLRLDGKLMENGRQFDVNLYRYRPGSRVTLEVYRDGSSTTFQVDVAERPEFADPLAAALASGRNLVEELGIFAVDLGRVFQHMPGPRSRRGVVVAALLDRLGSEVTFETGDVIYSVNRRSVGNVAELRLILSQLRDSGIVVFHLQRDGELIFVPVEVVW
ncbi:MAG: trypsin-like peptidase domain-containing protein [Gemmatimonadota bacterium]|nr:trypsin-like peptidase domain-containing protein [Gemmatimonadota bacterium]